MATSAEMSSTAASSPPEITVKGIMYEDSLKDSLDAYREMSFGMAWAMLIACSVAVVTNVLSIFVYTHASMRRTPINILLTGLSVIDLCLSLLSIPAFIVPGFFTYYHTRALEMIMCYSAVFVYPLTSSTHTASVWTFVVIAAERWHAVNQGGRDMASVGRQRSLLRHKHRRTCICALVAVCVLSLSYNLVRFFEFQLDRDESAAAPDGLAAPSEGSVLPYTVPIVVPLLRNSTNHPLYMPVYYVGLYLVTHFAVPFVTLVVVNGLTLHVVYAAKQRRKRLLTRRERREHRTTRMMITVVVMFILCYTLVFALNIIEAIDDSWFHTDENRLMAYALNDISNMLVITNAASTAFIYYIFNGRYRELCLALLSKLFARVSVSCCWCRRCWCRNWCLEFLDRYQRVLDRRRSTLVSTVTDHRNHNDGSSSVFTWRQDEGNSRTSAAGKQSFLLLSTSGPIRGRRLSSSSTEAGLIARTWTDTFCRRPSNCVRHLPANDREVDSG